MRIVISKIGLVTLEQLRPGQSARILAIEGGYGLQRRLRQMGVHPGDTVSVSSHGAFRGPLLVTIHGSRIALGRGVARRIAVQLLPHRPLGSGGLQ